MLYLRVPRLWRWAATVYVRVGVQFLVGLLVYRDEERTLTIVVGLGPIDAVITPVRMWTRREVRRRRAEQANQLAAEAADYLRTQA